MLTTYCADSHHVGVAYGRFDHYRLLDTLCILPSPPTDNGNDTGSLRSALRRAASNLPEALLLARYMMYSQVYFHSVRRIYDIHLRDFLRAWLPEGCFLLTKTNSLRITDNEVTAAIWEAADAAGARGHDPARRIVCRDHFRVVYARNPGDIQKNRQAVQLVYRPLETSLQRIM